MNYFIYLHVTGRNHMGKTWVSILQMIQSLQLIVLDEIFGEGAFEETLLAESVETEILHAKKQKDKRDRQKFT